MRKAVLKIDNTLIEFDGFRLTHVRGAETPFRMAQADFLLIREGNHPRVKVDYSPDYLNTVAQQIADLQDGTVIRKAPKLKAEPSDKSVVY